MPVYGASSSVDRTRLFQVVLRFVKDGGHPADVVAVLREVMMEEATRRGLRATESWPRAAAWLTEVVSFLKETAIR